MAWSGFPFNAGQGKILSSENHDPLTTKLQEISAIFLETRTLQSLQLFADHRAVFEIPDFIYSFTAEINQKLLKAASYE